MEGLPLIEMIEDPFLDLPNLLSIPDNKLFALNLFLLPWFLNFLILAHIEYAPKVRELIEN